MSDNLKLWDKVSKTNPEHTKKLSFGNKYTAIDPYQQIKNVTAEYGVAGIGWGWEVVSQTVLPTNFVSCQVRLWVGSPDKFIDQFGMAGLYMDKAQKMPDKDCMKKAVTDGLTKCFSYLGFNADVFLGKFDDNKYVAEMKAEFAETPKQQPKAKPVAKKQPQPKKTVKSEAQNKLYKVLVELAGMERKGASKIRNEAKKWYSKDGYENEVYNAQTKLVEAEIERLKEIKQDLQVVSGN